MDPTPNEQKSMEVIGFLEELGEDVGQYHRLYGRTETLDQDTARLCKKCQEVDVTKYSLELQIWWRDHQAADKRRLEEELKAKADDKAKAEALEKLTPYERELLGL